MAIKIRDRIRELRRVLAKDLKANPKNWRTHPPNQQRAMKAVLSEIGYADALVARETPDGLVLIDGHLRANTTPDQEVPVLVLDVTEEEADKILATLDPLAAMATADDALLRTLVDGIKAEDASFRDLIRDLRPRDAVIANREEHVPAEPETPIARPGDLWILGDHRLLCGDCTKPENVARLLEEVKPNLMVTDPPYGVEYDPHWRKEIGLNDSDRMGKVENDDRADWFEAWELFPGGIAYVWHAGKYAATVQLSLERAKFEVRSQIIWAKPAIVISRGHYHWQHEPCAYAVKHEINPNWQNLPVPLEAIGEHFEGHEPCWYAIKDGATAEWKGNRKQSTLWRIDSIPADRVDNVHGTQKPVDCMRRPMINHTEPGDAVYEPFSGSGTTIIAAETISRRCFALELNPVYVDVAIARWQTFTNQRARLHGSGEYFDEIGQR